MCSSCFLILTQFNDAKAAWIRNQEILENPETAFEDDDVQVYSEVTVEDEYEYSVDYNEHHQEYDDLQISAEAEDAQEDLTPNDCFENTSPAASSRPKRARTRPRSKSAVKSVDKKKGKEIYQRLLQKCPECDKVMEKNRMEGHLNKHRNVRPYICDAEDCGKTFYCKLLLRLHRTSIHTGKSHPCDICGKAFPSQRSLYAHKIRHTNLDRYQCDFCERRFNNSNSLKRHLAIHSGIREYTCETCNSSFYRKYNLDVHIRTVHNREKSHNCEYCPKKFGHARLLRDHIRRIHPEHPYEEVEEEILEEETE